MELMRLSETIDLKTIPIIALRQKGCLLLSRLLNPIKILPSEEGYPRDWRGIAYLSGIQSLYGTSVIGYNEQDAMTKVLNLWYKENKSMATFDNLRTFLGIIDRWDAADDMSEIFYEDAQYYLEMKRKSMKNNTNALPDINISYDENVITKDDMMRAQEGLPPQFYDAFVLFADEDIDFAVELIERMENYRLKLCVRERDLIGGISSEHEAILRLLSERCNRLIVIVSPAFLKSRANTFFVNYAQALGIEQGRRKIIPCLYERCTLPPALSFYFILNYQRSGKLWNFWEKLKDSIQCTPAELAARDTKICNNTSQVPSIQITEAVSNQSDIVQSSTITTKTTSTIPEKPPRKRSQQEISSLENSVQRMNINGCSNESALSVKRNITDNLQTLQIETDLRTQSLTNLESLKPQVHLSDCDKTKSNNDVSQLKSSQTATGKNTKWYRRILSVNSIFDGSIMKNSKKHLSKKKLAAVHS